MNIHQVNQNHIHGCNIYIYNFFTPHKYIRSLNSIDNHPNIYCGLYLPNDPQQLKIYYNPDNITRIDVEDFMYSLGGFITEDLS